MPAMETMADKHDLLAPEGTNDHPGRCAVRPVPSPGQQLGRNGCCLPPSTGDKVICTATFDQEQRTFSSSCCGNVVAYLSHLGD
jgi:hypothetical protein